MADVFCPHCMSMLADADEKYCPNCGWKLDLRAQPHQIPIGSVLRSENGCSYLFGEVKGSGGFGMTYIARELNSDTVVAIKEYYPVRCELRRMQDLSVQPEQRMAEIYRNGIKSFLSEASMLRALRDVNSIVRVLDYFEANNTAYMVMEYLNGATLSSLMQTQTRFEPSMLLRKMLPLMQDLQRIHDAGVLHRDIAPDNVMLMPDGSLKLLDFGCARSMEDGKSMTVMLKPGFAPVEQYQTRGQGQYTDVYALCATIYYCLTGTFPPDAPGRLLALSDERDDPLKPCSALGADVPPELDRIILWGMALQPVERAQSMNELARHIKTILDAQYADASDPGSAAQTIQAGHPSGAGADVTRFARLKEKIKGLTGPWRWIAVFLLLVCAWGLVYLLRDLL